MGAPPQPGIVPAPPALPASLAVAARCSIFQMQPWKTPGRGEGAAPTGRNGLSRPRLAGVRSNSAGGLRRGQSGGYSFGTLIAELATRCRHIWRLTAAPDSPPISREPRPTPLQSRALELRRVLPIPEAWSFRFLYRVNPPIRGDRWCFGQRQPQPCRRRSLQPPEGQQRQTGTA